MNGTMIATLAALIIPLRDTIMHVCACNDSGWFNQRLDCQFSHGSRSDAPHLLFFVLRHDLISRMANSEYLDRGCELEIVTEEPRGARPIPVPVPSRGSQGDHSSQIVQRLPK